MKKFMKGSGITLAIVLVLGLILITAGGCGGGFKNLSEQIANGEFNLNAEDLEGFLWKEEWGTYDAASMTMFNGDMPIVKDTESYEETISAEGIQKLELELGGCEVYIETSPDGDYHVTAEKISAFQTYTENSTLYVRGLQNGNWNGKLNTNMKVTLQIPAETNYDKVEMSLGAGDFTIETLTADDIRIEVGAGRLQISSLRADKLKIELGAGQTIIKEAEVTSSAELTTGVGELIFEGSIPGDLTAECAMGNMEIKITGSTESDHNFKLECAAGNLTAGSKTISAGLGEQNVDNGVASDYDLECAMGNLTLTFE
ncbi:MAG: DUF4097 family beta strand repeat-containing protein [Lachnospiraceae bacterium]